MAAKKESNSKVKKNGCQTRSTNSTKKTTTNVRRSARNCAKTQTKSKKKIFNGISKAKNMISKSAKVKQDSKKLPTRTRAKNISSQSLETNTEEPISKPVKTTQRGKSLPSVTTSNKQPPTILTDLSDSNKQTAKTRRSLRNQKVSRQSAPSLTNDEISKKPRRPGRVSVNAVESTISTNDTSADNKKQNHLTVKRISNRLRSKQAVQNDFAVEEVQNENQASAEQPSKRIRHSISTKKIDSEADAPKIVLRPKLDVLRRSLRSNPSLTHDKASTPTTETTVSSNKTLGENLTNRRGCKRKLSSANVSPTKLSSFEVADSSDTSATTAQSSATFSRRKRKAKAPVNSDVSSNECLTDSICAKNELVEQSPENVHSLTANNSIDGQTDKIFESKKDEGTINAELLKDEDALNSNIGSITNEVNNNVTIEEEEVTADNNIEEKDEPVLELKDNVTAEPVEHMDLMQEVSEAIEVKSTSQERLLLPEDDSSDKSDEKNEDMKPESESAQPVPTNAVDENDQLVMETTTKQADVTVEVSVDEPPTEDVSSTACKYEEVAEFEEERLSDDSVELESAEEIAPTAETAREECGESVVHDENTLVDSSDQRLPEEKMDDETADVSETQEVQPPVTPSSNDQSEEQETKMDEKLSQTPQAAQKLRYLPITREILTVVVKQELPSVEKTKSAIKLLLVDSSKVNRVSVKQLVKKAPTQQQKILQTKDTSEVGVKLKSKIRASKTTPAATKKTKYKEIDDCKILCEVELVTNNDRARKCKCIQIEGDCGQESCLNRAMRYECPKKCDNGSSCKNRRFQNQEYAKLEVFDTDKKGRGVRALEAILRGTFIIEYIGEIIDLHKFHKRAKRYGRDPKHKHHYVMSLNANTYIDATKRGNMARFINHSCDPNAATEKWTVDRRNRIGFFAIKDIQAGEEIVFDYKFERFGKTAQKCYCGSAKCRGIICAETDDGQQKETVFDESIVSSDSSCESSSDESDVEIRPKCVVETVKTEKVEVAEIERKSDEETRQFRSRELTEKWEKIGFKDYRIPKKSTITLDTSVSTSTNSEVSNASNSQNSECAPTKRKRRSRFEPIGSHSVDEIASIPPPKLVPIPMQVSNASCSNTCSSSSTPTQQSLTPSYTDNINQTVNTLTVSNTATTAAATTTTTATATAPPPAADTGDTLKPQAQNGRQPKAVYHAYAGMNSTSMFVPGFPPMSYPSAPPLFYPPIMGAPPVMDFQFPAMVPGFDPMMFGMPPVADVFDLAPPPPPPPPPESPTKSDVQVESKT